MAGWFPLFSSPIGTGWNVLPLGCGGFATGMFISNDGSMVCRTDVGNIYRFTGKTTDYADPSKVWAPLLNYTSLAGQGTSGGVPVCNDNPGGWEHVLAPNHSNVHGAIFPDMQGVSTKGWFWSGTWNGTDVIWVKSNLAFLNNSVSPNYNMKLTQQKVAFDPANPDIVYVGCPSNDGNSAGAYTSLNKAGGSSLATLTSVKTAGSTPIPDTAATSYMPHGSSVSAGIAIDANSGTTTIGGQTVTNRIIIPIAGSGIYESTDGGNTFTEVAASALGTADFYVPTGYFTAEGVYYCVVTNSSIGGVYRYKSGVWTKISTGLYAASNYYDGVVSLLVDHRNTAAAKAYLSIFGPNGFGIGYTSTNANTGSPPTWTGATSGQAPFMKSAAYDLVYINEIFGQGPGGFAAANGACIDGDGVCWWPGNQSLFYLGSSDVSPVPATNGGPSYPTGAGTKRFIGNTSGISTTLTVTTDPIYGAPTGIAPGMVINAKGLVDGVTIVSQSSGTAGGPGVYIVSAPIQLTNASCMLDGFRTYSWSMGRGMEATVAEGAVRPPGGPYPVLAVQDLGAPMRGTYTTYPKELAVPFEEWTCECVDFAVTEPNCVVARTTGQSGAGSIIDASKYSLNYGADGTWTPLNAYPIYNASITAGVSNGAGGAGFILNITACTGVIRETAYISATNLAGGAYYGVVQPYGTGGTTGTGGVGTYMLDASSFLAPGSSVFSVQFVQGGQTVAIDRDRWLTVPSGFGSQSYKPSFTANATGAAAWVDTNLPSWQWTGRGWAFGAGTKPFALGNGTALGTMWAMQVPRSGSGTATLWRTSTPYDPTSFAAVLSWAIAIETGVYCLAVPGFPDELWVTALFTGGVAANTGLWHITNANSASPTLTKVGLPTSPVTEVLPICFTLGAPATPGGYPQLYIICNQGGGAVDPVTRRLYKGTLVGGANNPAATINWSLYGPTGTQADFPKTCQLQGIQSLSGDWDIPGLIYATTAGCGLAYYNP